MKVRRQYNHDPLLVKEPGKKWEAERGKQKGKNTLDSIPSNRYYTPMGYAMEEKRKRIMDRFKRIEGQLRGLQKMVANEGPCEEILIQIAAVTAAMKRAGAAVVEAYMEECMEKSRRQPEEALADFRKALTRYVDLA